MLASATRMVFLTFLPFPLGDKGADMATLGLGLGLGLIFAGGGGTDKLACGVVATRVGPLRPVIPTGGCTGILTACPLPLRGRLAGPR